MDDDKCCCAEADELDGQITNLRPVDASFHLYL